MLSAASPAYMSDCQVKRTITSFLSSSPQYTHTSFPASSKVVRAPFCSSKLKSCHSLSSYLIGIRHMGVPPLSLSLSLNLLLLLSEMLLTDLPSEITQQIIGELVPDVYEDTIHLCPCLNYNRPYGEERCSCYPDLSSHLSQNTVSGDINACAPGTFACDKQGYRHLKPTNLPTFHQPTSAVNRRLRQDTVAILPTLPAITLTPQPSLQQPLPPKPAPTPSPRLTDSYSNAAPYPA